MNDDLNDIRISRELDGYFLRDIIELIDEDSITIFKEYLETNNLIRTLECTCGTYWGSLSLRVQLQLNCIPIDYLGDIDIIGNLSLLNYVKTHILHIDQAYILMHTIFRSRRNISREILIAEVIKSSRYFPNIMLKYLNFGYKDASILNTYSLKSLKSSWRYLIDNLGDVVRLFKEGIISHKEAYNFVNKWDTSLNVGKCRQYLDGYVESCAFFGITRLIKPR